MSLTLRVRGDISYPYHRKAVRYGDEHDLQTLDICLPRPLESPLKESNRVWIVFIHGGAWRDPLQDSAELQPALKQLLNRNSSKDTIDHIAGLASINYGLSRGDEKERSLNVTHPQHIQDIILALNWLRIKYSLGINSDWIAVGHSCGATLALQVCMSYAKSWGSRALGRWSGRPPAAVVGLEGIYDLNLLVRNHSDQPVYAGFVRDAFGDDEKVWFEASPTNGEYGDMVRKGGMGLIILAHSTEDELVEWEQLDAMKKCLEERGWKNQGEDAIGSESSVGQNKKEILVLKLTGLHDQVWSEGRGLRLAIEAAVERVVA